jgi:capsular polysaccharide biosynthesis protein
MDLWVFSSAIRRHKFLFGIAFVLALLASIAIPRNGAKPVYTSVAKVLLTPPNSSQGGGFDSSRWWFADEATLRELITSENLLDRVIKQAQLKTDWTELRTRVTLAPVMGTGGFRGGALSLFQVSVQADTPAGSKAIEDVLIDEFVRYIQELSAQEFANTRRFLEELVAEAHQKVDEAQSKMLAITSRKEIAADDKDAGEAQRELETEKYKLREELASVQADLATASEFVHGHTGLPPWSLLQQNSTMLHNLESAVSENRLKLLDLQGVYSKTNRLVLDQTEKLAEVQRLYDNNMSATAGALIKEKSIREKELKEQLEQTNKRLSELRQLRLTPEEKREVAKLERQLQVWDDNQLTLVRQLYQARVVEQSSRRQGAISILEKPALGILPRDKELPSLMKILPIGIPFSLFFAAALVMLVDYMSSSLQLAPRIESSLGMAVIAVIPKMPLELSREWEKRKSALENRHLEGEPTVEDESRW